MSPPDVNSPDLARQGLDQEDGAGGAQHCIEGSGTVASRLPSLRRRHSSPGG